MTEEQQKIYERKAELFVGENYGYYEKQWRGIKRELKVLAQTNQLTEWEAIQYIKKLGGTNVLGIFVALLITVFLAFAVFAGTKSW